MDPKELLLRHFEKIVLVAFGAFMVVGLILPIASPPPELKMNEQLQATIETVDNHMKTYTPKAEAPPDVTADLKRQIDSSVAAADANPAWTMHRRPNLAFTPVAVAQKVYPKHEPPVDFRIADKARGKVKLTWKPSPENELVDITGYEIQRKDGEAGEWKKIAENLSGDKNDYDDLTVAPRAKYYYRLLETAAAQLQNPVIIRDGTNLDPAKKTLQAEDPKDPVETPRDCYITLDSGQIAKPAEDPPVKGEAQVKVWKWNATLGKFVFKAYINGVTEGTKIGKLEKNFKFEGKNMGDIDFTTDAVLTEMGTAQREVKGNKKQIMSAKITWPWKDGEEMIYEKEPPQEIADQIGKKK
jgi:hypothetical protein